MKGHRNNLDLVDPSLFGSQGKLESKTSQPLLLLRPTSCSCGSLRPIRSASTPLQRGWRCSTCYQGQRRPEVYDNRAVEDRYPKPVYVEFRLEAVRARSALLAVLFSSAEVNERNSEIRAASQN